MSVHIDIDVSGGNVTVKQKESKPSQQCFIVYTPVIVVYAKSVPIAYTTIAFLFDVYNTTVTIPFKVIKPRGRERGNANVPASDVLDVLCRLYVHNFLESEGTVSVGCTRVSKVFQPICPTSYVLFKEASAPTLKYGMGRLTPIAVSGSLNDLSVIASGYVLTTSSRSASTYVTAPTAVQFVASKEQLQALIDTLVGGK